MRELGSPHETLPVISVAGSNGKGSACNFLSSILSESGIRTGLYTSPHIFRYAERIKIDGEEISRRDFRETLRRVREAERNTGESLSVFEKLTAAALMHFSGSRCVYSVMEAGLGGRLDATNLCGNKNISLITSISLEHTRILGSSVEDISREKAGVIRPGYPVIDGSGTPYIRESAISAGSRVYTYGREFKTAGVRSSGGGEYTYDLFMGKKVINDISPGMRGEHQVLNSALAAAAALVLGIGEEEVRRGIVHAKNPGRLDIFDMGEEKRFIVDAAHNPAGIRVLDGYIRSYFPGSRVFLIIGLYRDKDYVRMAEILDETVFRAWTLAPDRERSLPARELSGVFTDASEAGSFSEAAAAALDGMERGDVLLACGSLSIVKPALSYAYEKFT